MSRLNLSIGFNSRWCDFRTYFNERNIVKDRANSYYKVKRTDTDYRIQTLEMALQARGFRCDDIYYFLSESDGPFFSKAIVRGIDSRHTESPSCLINDILTALDSGKKFKVEYEFSQSNWAMKESDGSNYI